MSIIGGLALGGAKRGAGMGIDMATTKWQQKRQLEQNAKIQEQNLAQAGKLQQLQMSGQKEMGKYNQGLALDTWNKTSYAAQRKQIDKAGLSAGLIYGGSGGGGVTTSTPAGNVGSYGAEGGAEMPRGLGIQSAMALELAEAGIDKLRSEAEKNRADATKTSGVDTDLTNATIKEKEAQTLKLGAETNNEELKGIGIAWENENKRIQAEVAKEGKDDVLRALKANADKYESEADSAASKAKVDKSTINDNIQKARLTNQLMGVQILAEKEGIKLTKAQTDATYKAMERMNAEMYKWSAERQQEYWRLSLKEQEIQNSKMFAEAYKQVAEFNTGTMAELQRLVNIGGTVMTGIPSTPMTETTTTTKEVRNVKGGRNERTETTRTK